MSISVYKCTFSDTGTYTIPVKSSSSSNAVFFGTLSSMHCPGRVFYCYSDVMDDTGRSPDVTGCYKLVSPEKYEVTQFISDAPQDMFVNVNVALNGTHIIKSKELTTLNSEADIKSQAEIDAEARAAEGLANFNNPDYRADYSVSAASMEDTTNVTPGENVYVKAINSILNSSESEDDKIRNVIKNINKISNVITDETGYLDTVFRTMTAFNKYKTAFPDLQLGRAIPYVFFTRPDINLYTESTGIQVLDTVANDPVLYGLYKSDPMVLQSLTSSLSKSHSFIPFLSNLALSFDISDENIETLATGETFTGWRVKYGRHNVGYKSSGSFNISYTDTNKLYVYKLHKAWVEYISKVYRGELESKQQYIHERRLDYACSTYYFLCAPDGETILYWSKYVGVFPTSVPTGTLSWNKGNVITNPESNISYEYSWKADMELPVLVDFNYNSGLDNTSADSISYSPNYHNSILGGGYTFANAPFVQLSTDKEGQYVFKLRFKI